MPHENQKVSDVKESPENIESDFDENKIYQIENISIEDTKMKIEWRKCAFECKLKNTYGIENRNAMTRMHDNEVNKISEWNLLHDIINPPKHTKFLKRHYYPILHGCMNTRKGRAKFKNFCILLDSGCIYIIIIGRIVGKLSPEKHAVMHWHTQAGNRL